MLYVNEMFKAFDIKHFIIYIKYFYTFNVFSNKNIKNDKNK